MIITSIGRAAHGQLRLPSMWSTSYSLQNMNVFTSQRRQRHTAADRKRTSHGPAVWKHRVFITFLNTILQSRGKERDNQREKE